MANPNLGNYPPPHDSDITRPPTPPDPAIVTLKDVNFTLQDDLDPTKEMQFQLAGITTATQRTLTVPNGSGTLALLEQAQTFSGLQTVDTELAGPLNLAFNGSVTPNVITLSDANTGFVATLLAGSSGITAARTLTIPNATGTFVLQGAALNLASQGASIGTTTLFTAVANHAYLVTVYLRTSTAGQATDNVTVTLGWTDSVAQTRIVTFQNNGATTAAHDLSTLNATSQGSVVIFCSSASAVTYATTLANLAGTPDPLHNLRIRAVDLS